MVPADWLMSEPMVASCAFSTPAPPPPPPKYATAPPFPPPILPLLVSRLIVPAFDTPEPPTPPRLAPKPPVPPRIAPMLDRLVIVPAFDTPAPPPPPTPLKLAPAPTSPLPLRIAPLLDSVLIWAGDGVDREAGAALSAIDRAAVGQSRDLAGVRNPAPPQRPRPKPPVPPLILPTLDRAVILPAFNTPAPPAPPEDRSRRFRH